MDRSAESIIKELSTMYSVTRDIKDQEILHSTSNRLKTFFRRLDYLAALDLDDKSAEDILSAPEFDLALESIVRFRNLYSLRLETANANSILDSEDPWDALKRFTHFSNYLQLALTEYQGSGLEPGDSVVFIGSGPLPLSLIMLCHQHGLRGIGIEQEPARARLSRRVLMQLGLSDQIEIIEGNHFGLPSNGCKLVMVAAAAEPKKEIFDHLANMIPAGTKISYRIYEKGLRRLLETSSFLELPEQFEEYLRIRPKPPVNNTVIFLTKRGR
ncbi:MAG: methyltransferase [Candidatus Methanogaster sp.]|uniref:Methyltransferase n=1 Tax=Candidatus Methanogaster sp. TaxID=3386292 RepID=A0AC61KZY4_9EURY|nr:MAG: methyltransferase [ANME-2 cluster archaeon]